MRIWVGSLKRLKQAAAIAGVLTAGALLVCYPQAAQNGVRHGMATCAALLIPSLFPFLVLSGFVIRSGFAAAIGRWLSPLTTRLFGFSGDAATAMLISVLGGYPAGANAICTLLEQDSLSHRDAKRLLRCCVHAGPAFVVGGIGVGMLGSVKAGVLLLAAHLLASFIVALSERDTPTPVAHVSSPTVGGGTALAQSVHQATASLMAMCGFVLLASTLLSLCDALATADDLHNVWRCLFACVAEVTTGCTEAARMGVLAPFWLGAALGFGGLSVHGQIAATCNIHRLMDVGFFRARLLHALLGGGLSLAAFWLWGPSPVAFAVWTKAALSSVTTQNPAVETAGLMAVLILCVIFVTTLPRKAR